MIRDAFSEVDTDGCSQALTKRMTKAILRLGFEGVVLDSQEDDCTFNFTQPPQAESQVLKYLDR